MQTTCHCPCKRKLFEQRQQTIRLVACVPCRLRACNLLHTAVCLTHTLLQDADDYSKDYVERDEKRLGDLGRRTVEMYALSHIFGELEAAYCEAESIKRQDALIREEEEAGQLEGARTAARIAADREKKARKKVLLMVSLTVRV